MHELVYMCVDCGGVWWYKQGGMRFAELVWKAYGPYLAEVQRGVEGDAQAGPWDPAPVGRECQVPV